MTVDMIHGETFHGRKGAVKNSFRYTVDYVALDAEAPVHGPTLFGRNRRNLTALWDKDHGGPPGQGRGAAWVREVLATHDLPAPAKIILMAQPRILGHVFNPVSFWLCYDDANTLRTAIAEVSNTYGDRHAYLAHHDNHGPITRTDTLSARKIFHVSPFQPIGGGYAFRFDITDSRIGIWIDYTTPGGGLYTNLTGPRVPLTNTGILRACLRRPFGSRRVLALIHWQALKLALKGAKFRSRPAPPAEDVTR
ncbi:MAG: DUF1365 domain-containing protein [Paracoccaceae bacterium]